MNLSAIKAVCHGGKRATIYRSMGGGGQWISNGFAAYRVKGVEIENAEALMELWNLSDKARSKAVILEEITSDPRFRPTVSDEEQLDLLGTAGLAEGAHYVALKSANGVLWIDADLLRPLKLDYANYFARWAHGRPMVAVYEDLEGAEALILPAHNIVAAEMMEAADKMSNRTFHWPSEDEEAAEAERAAEAMFRQADDDKDGADDGEVQS